MNAVKLLNLHVLELFVNYMTILTASMGTSIEQYRSRKRRMSYHMFNGVGFLSRLSQMCFTWQHWNSGHVQKWWAKFCLHPIACKGKWRMWRTIQTLQYLIRLIQKQLCLLATSQGTEGSTLWWTLVSSVLQIMFACLSLKFAIK